jgi:hypothetical protein
MYKKHKVEMADMAAINEEYGTCLNCDKPFEEMMGSCRGCGTERTD